MSGLLRRVRRVHFVGIGGVGMCGLAEILHVQGVRVSGSDLEAGPTVARLRELGIEVGLGHDPARVGDADVVVTSSAIRPGNPEVVEARRRHVPVIPRAEMLAEIMRVKEGIAVAGTHGKTTTTSMIAHVLEAAGLDPTAVIGGRVRGSGSDPAARTGARLGRGELLVAEADESDGSFLRLAPVMAVVTNIEPEHLDHWASFEALLDGFATFAGSVPFFGLAVVCLDDPGVQRILPHLERRVTTYGFSVQADLVGGALDSSAAGTRFSVTQRGVAQGRVELPQRPWYDALNALATLGVALELGVSFEQAASALRDFPGVERRFESKGRARGVHVIDDYGHHPGEIRATLAAARRSHAGRIVVVFQPHRYTRTRDLLDDFGAAFHDADRVVVTDIYAAGEEKIPGVDSESLVEAIRARGHRDVALVREISAVPGPLAAALREGDLVLTLGAGSVADVGPALLRALEEAG